MIKQFKLLLFVGLIAFAQASAQVPQKISYQAVIKDAEGALYKNKDVAITVSIVKDEEAVNSIYKETHSTHTNSNGLVSLEIGSGECIDCGHGFGFSMIDWGEEGPFFIKTETIINGQAVTSIGELLSVPFALYAHESAKVSGFTVGTDVPEDAVFTDNQTASDVAIETINNLDATNVQMALEKLQEVIVAAGNMKQSDYDTNGDGIVDNAEKVNGFEVLTSVPENAIFTDDQKATEIALSEAIDIRGTEATTVEEAIIRLQEEFIKLKEEMSSTGD